MIANFSLNVENFNSWLIVGVVLWDEVALRLFSSFGGRGPVIVLLGKCERVKCNYVVIFVRANIWRRYLWTQIQVERLITTAEVCTQRQEELR